MCDARNDQGAHLSSISAHMRRPTILGCDCDLWSDSCEHLVQMNEIWCDDNLYIIGDRPLIEIIDKSFDRLHCSCTKNVSKDPHILM